MRLILIAAVLASALLAGEPKVSAEARAKFWRAMAELHAVKPAYDRASKGIQDAQQAITKECGDKHVPNVDAAGEPVCVPKPEPPKPEAKQ